MEILTNSLLNNKILHGFRQPISIRFFETKETNPLPALFMGLTRVALLLSFWHFRVWKVNDTLNTSYKLQFYSHIEWIKYMKNWYRVLHIFLSPLKLICSLTEQSYSHFQTLSQFSCFRALKEYITFSKVNWLKNGRSSKFEVQK